MIFLRKLEMGCGLATGLLAIATAGNMLSADFEATRRLARARLDKRNFSSKYKPVGSEVI